MDFIDQNVCVVFAVQRQQDPNDGNNGLMSQSAGDGSFQLVSDGDEVTLINCYYNVIASCSFIYKFITMIT